MGCYNSKKTIDEMERIELEIYARGIKLEHLKSAILYYEWACDRWHNAAMRESCIRALEEAKYVPRFKRKEFLEKVPKKVLINEDFQESLRAEWSEIILEEAIMTTYYDDASLKEVIENLD